MNSLLQFPTVIFHSILILSLSPKPTISQDQRACKTRCGSIDIKFPFGSGHGCGSPRFHPYVTCAAAAVGGGGGGGGGGDHLRLTTHTGTYPITSISYADSVITVSPPCMSNCTAMQQSPTNFGLDWTGPFQPGPSSFILLSCSPSISSVTVNGNPICDPSSIYLCASIYTCPAVVSLGLPLFPATNSCCVYSPANLDPKDELDLEELGCEGYSSVVALGDVPADPARWRYGVALKYTLGGLDSYNIAPGCRGCEQSGGVCGYAPPRNSFVCVCESGNTSTDCYSYNWIYTSSSLPSSGYWVGIFVVTMLLLVI